MTTPPPYPPSYASLHPSRWGVSRDAPVAPTEESPLYANAKQFHRILQRRVARRILEEALRSSPKKRKPYLHEAGGRYAIRRPRGPDGRLLTADEVAELERRNRDAKDPPSRRFRRECGPRQVIGENGTNDPNDPDFFVRDFEFRSTSESPNQARYRLDSQCHVPLLVSEHWVQENEKGSEVSTDFHDLGVQSVSGHDLHINGILRNTVFNLKGSTVTHRRDIYVCKQLNFWADVIASAKFMAEQLTVLFSKAKKMFAGIFSSRKEKAGISVFIPLFSLSTKTDHFHQTRKPKEMHCKPMLTAKLTNKNISFERGKKQKLVKDKKHKIGNLSNSSGMKLDMENGRSINGKSIDDASTAMVQLPACGEDDETVYP